MPEGMRAVLTALCFILAAFSAIAEPLTLEAGNGRFDYRDPPEYSGETIPVWFVMPKDFSPDTPIVFVMHGVSRNADGYRDAWSYLADHHKLLVLAPEFSKERFPKSWRYNLGNLAHPFKAGDPIRMRPENEWTYPIVDRIFERIQSALATRQKSFALYGHSAGGQFVHRYLTFTGGGNVAIALAANAGWYTLPDYAVPFPYGLGGTGLPESQLRQAFGEEMIVLLGDKDTKQGRHLRRTPEAMQQGPNRFERGQYYLEAARNEAAALNAPFQWRIEIVPGVGHSNAGMAPTAARLIAEHYEGRR
jgi:poly(3-hydroxybutyrate) depolymerase